jgi:Fe-S-cluster containining protein
MSLADYYRGLTAVQQRLAGAPTAAPVELAAAAVNAAAALDELLAAEPAAGAACAPGCAFCCHFPVGVTLAEALALRDAVAALPAGERGAIERRTRAAAAAVAALPWPDLAAALLPCPLLGADRRCRVYAARPLPCRAFRSADARACERAFAAGGAALPPATDGAGLRAGRGATAALATAGGAPLPGVRELRSALAALFATADRDLLAVAHAFAGARSADD